MSVEDDLQFFNILEEIDVDDYDRHEMTSIRRQNLPVTRGLVKRIKQTQHLRKRKEGEPKTNIDWSKYSDASFYGHPVSDQNKEAVRSRFWDSRTRRRHLSQPEVLQRITEVTSEVALRKRRRSHVDVEVTVSPAPSPRIGPLASPDHLLDEGFSIIPDHEVMSDIASHRRLSTDSYFSQPENFEYNSAYETDCEYVHNPSFLEQITSRAEDQNVVNSKPELEPSGLIGMDEMKDEEQEKPDAPIFEALSGDSMDSPSSTFQPELDSEENNLPFSLAPDGLVDINTLDLGFYEPEPISLPAPSDLSTATHTSSTLSLPPETDNHGVEELLRGLDEVDRFEKDLLQKMADLNRSMHEGFQNVDVGFPDDTAHADILALEDANFRTASESRRGRTSIARWDSVVFSGKRGSIISQREPDSPDFLRSEIEDLKIQNKQLQKEVRHLHRQLTNAKKRLGDEAPPVSSFFNSSSLTPCNSDSESLVSELSDLPQFTNVDSPEEKQSILDWLMEIDCESCYHIFLDYGIDEISELSNLDYSILHNMQIPLEQKQRILDRIQPPPPRINNENKARNVQRHLKKESKYLSEKGIPLSTIWQPVCRFVKRYTWIWQPALFFACIVVNIDFFEANYDG